MFKRLAKEKMQEMTQWAGVLLMGLAVGAFSFSYFSTHKFAMTALIPGVWGVLFLILGQLAKRAEYKKAAMHTVTAVALLGILLPLSRLMMNLRKLYTKEMAMGQFSLNGLISLSVMIITCATIFALCFYSFRLARRERAN